MINRIIVFIFVLLTTSEATLLTPKGKVTAFIGSAYREDLAGVKSDLKLGSDIYEGDTIYSKADTKLKITLNDKSDLNLGPLSKLKLERLENDTKKPGSLWLMSGAVRATVTKGYSENPKMVIKTKSASMGIRGTDLQVVANPVTGNSTLVTLEGNVSLAKTTNSVAPTLNESQIKVMSEVARVTENELEKQTPNVSKQMILQMNEAAKLTEKELSPPIPAAQEKALADTAALVTAKITPQLSTKEIMAYYEVTKVLQDNVTLDSKQVAMIEKVKDIAALASEGKFFKTNLDQIQALAQIEKLADSKLKPNELSPEAKLVFSQVKATESKVEPVSKLDEQQFEAMKSISKISRPDTAATQTQLSAEQALAVAQLSGVVDKVIDKNNLNPTQIQNLENTNKLSSKIESNAKNITADQAQAIKEIHAMANQVSKVGDGKLVNLNVTQTAALIKTENAVSSILPSDKISTALSKMIDETKKIENKAPDISQMSLNKINEIKEIKNLIAESNNSAGAPVTVTNEQAEAMSSIQKTAKDVVKVDSLNANEKLALTINEQVTKVISQDVQTPPAPIVEVTKTLTDPAKSLPVLQGQFSGIALGQEPSMPVKVAPAQIEAMKNADSLATKDSAKSVNTNQNSIVSAVTGKTLISPVPPGLDAKDVMPSIQDMKDAMSKGGINLPVEAAVNINDKNLTGKNLTAANSPPPEGFFDSKSGKMAPPAGGFVDMNTGVYLPPPAGSAFDPIAGVFVPPPTMGTIDPKSGGFVPPPGFVLDSSRGLITAPIAGTNSNTSTATNFNPQTALVGMNPNAVSTTASAASMFAGMSPVNFSENGMVGALPPPGMAPGQIPTGPGFMMSANNAYVPSDFSNQINSPGNQPMGTGGMIMGLGENGNLIAPVPGMMPGMLPGGMLPGGSTMYAPNGMTFDPMMPVGSVPNYNQYTGQQTYPTYDPYACQYSGSCNTTCTINCGNTGTGTGTTSVTSVTVTIQ